MSTFEVNSIQPLSSGTTITLGANGKTLDVPSGATLDLTGSTVSGLTTGKIGQVVNTPVTTATFTTSTSLVSTNFTASITPSSTSSKIFGLFLARSYVTPANNEMVGQISSAATTPWQGYLVFNTGGNIATQQCIPFYDSPSTTSAVTYTFKIRSVSGGNVSLHPNGATDGTGGFTLMEVLA